VALDKNELEKRIAASIAGTDGTVGVALASLKEDESILINSREVFHAASIIKIVILAELLRQVESGEKSLYSEVVLTDEHKIGGAGVLQELHSGLALTVEDCAILMIIVSDNTASNILIDTTGMDRINALIREAGMECSALRKKFMIELSDPSIFNVTSPGDTMLLLKKLYNREILGPEMTDKALDILSRQQYREKIPLYLPEELKIANKTGEVTGVRHDAAIVYLKEEPYVLVVFTKDQSDPLRADRIIGEISRDVFTYFSGKAKKE